MTEPGREIMVVDDDVNIRSVLQYKLEKEGYLVTLASDGLDALNKLELSHPDLIILDLAMPRVDGMEVLSRLKENPSTHDIPVIVLTALNGLHVQSRSAQLGAARFVHKPFSPRQIVADVQEVLAEVK